MSRGNAHKTTHTVRGSRRPVLGALAVASTVVASACTVSEARGVRLSSTTRPVSCSDLHVRGELADTAPPGFLRVTLTAEHTCGDSTVTVYRLHRQAHLNPVGVTAAMLATGLSTALGVMGVYAISTSPPPPETAALHRSVGEVLAWVGFGLGLGLGAIPAALVGVELQPGTETEERPGPREVKALAWPRALDSGGTGQRWALENGQGDIELEAADLESATADGVPVTWSPVAAHRLACLSACRRALAGWAPGQAPDCGRYDLALRCAEGGWRQAEVVKASLSAACGSASAAAPAFAPPGPRPQAVPLP